MRPLLLAALIASLVSFAIPGRCAAATAVTSCGQQVVGDGYLPAALNCTGFSGYAVTIIGGTFSLGGFTLTGGTVGNFGSVYCPAKCEVVGPGTITGSDFAGIVAFGPLRTTDVNLTNHTAYGVECFKSCKLEGGTISGNGDGVVGGTRAKIRGVTIDGNVGYGVRVAKTVVIRESSVSGNGDEGITADRRVMVEDSTVSGNAEHGIRAGSEDCSSAGVAKIKNATVTGNGTAPDCGVSETCADVASCRPPKIKDGATCGTSYVQNTGFPGQDWNVCTLD